MTEPATPLPLQAAVLRDEGIAKITQSCSGWIEQAVTTIAGLSRSYPTFTSDQLRPFGPPPHPNAVGAAFRIAHQQGLIEHCGYVRALHPSTHHRIVSVWRAKVQDGA